MERTDQYPEVVTDDSGLVPPQGHKGEWPKKIRTLTAVELDRLTIDGDGRFYWDGKLVNYDSQRHAEGRPADLDALAILDRAAAELSGQPGDQTQARGDTASIEQHYAPVTVAPATAVAVPTLAPAYARPDKVRLSLSPLQSVGLFLVFIGFLAGVLGVAASGFVAAHEWGCKAGLVKSYCPAPPPAPKEPPRADIPA